MKLEEFIEKDMKDFLDSVAEREREEEVPGLMREEEVSAYDFSKDYAKEVHQALEKGNLEQARSVFMKLRRDYDKFDEKSTEQKKAYSILEELYGEINEYLESLPKSVITPRSLDEYGLGMPKTPYTIDEMPPEERERLESKKEEVLSDIDDSMKEIEGLLKEGDLSNSIKTYKEMKERFKDIPEIFEEERKTIYDEIIATYYGIRKMWNRLQKATQKAAPSQMSKAEDGQEAGMPPAPEPQASGGEQSQEPEVPIPSSPEHMEEIPDESEEEKDLEKEEHENVVEEDDEESAGKKEKLQDRIDEVRNAIKGKDAELAFKKYKEAKKMFAKLNVTEEEKEEFFKDLLGVYHSLVELENHLMERSQKPMPAESNFQPEEPSLEDRLNKAKIKAYKFLDNGDLESAIMQYDRIRELFEKLEEGEHKERLYRELMDIHDQIINARKNDTITKEPEAGKHIPDVEQINSLISAGKMEEAKHLFLEMQQKALSIEDPEEKKQLYRVLDSIKNRIQMAGSVSDQERLMEA